MKRIFSLLLIIVLTLPAIAANAGEALHFGIEDAYSQCKSAYPDFIRKFYDQRITDRQLITFITDLRNYLYNVNKNDHTVTWDTFGDDLMDAIEKVSAYRRNIAVQDALLDAFPDAVTEITKTHVLPDEFAPLYEMMRSLIFTHHMLEDNVAYTVSELSYKNGGFVITTRLYNYGGGGVLYVARYGEGRLLSVKSAAFDGESYVFENATELKCDGIKLFAWDGGGITPITGFEKVY